MALFTGTYENKVDRKGRTSLPADFRAELPDGDARVVYVFRSPNLKALEACDKAFMQRVADSLEQYDMFSDAEDDLGSALIAGAKRISLDGEGRMMLPPEYAEYAGITERVAFVGRGSRFQLWDPDTFNEYAASARARAKGRTLKLSRPEDER